MITTQTLLRNLFDFQLFAKNERLEHLIAETIDASNEGRALSDDELEVWAAGDPDASFPASQEEDDA